MTHLCEQGLRHLSKAAPALCEPASAVPWSPIRTSLKMKSCKRFVPVRAMLDVAGSLPKLAPCRTRWMVSAACRYEGCSSQLSSDRVSRSSHSPRPARLLRAFLLLAGLPCPGVRGRDPLSLGAGLGHRTADTGRLTLSNDHLVFAILRSTETVRRPGNSCSKARPSWRWQEGTHENANGQSCEATPQVESAPCTMQQGVATEAQL